MTAGTERFKMQTVQSVAPMQLVNSYFYFLSAVEPYIRSGCQVYSGFKTFNIGTTLRMQKIQLLKVIWSIWNVYLRLCRTILWFKNRKTFFVFFACSLSEA